jgi:photosystem II stability/assembly factor-like uncharacterized protein
MKHFVCTAAIFLTLITRLHGQWEIMNQGARGNLTAMDFVNEHTGWFAGFEGFLLKTEDGGESWNMVMQDNSLHIRILDFASESVGWAAAAVEDGMVYRERIIRTVDGGETWRIFEVIPDSVYWIGSIFAVEENILYAIVTTESQQPKILKTPDGGESWEEITPNGSWLNLNSVCFVNSDTGFVSGNFVMPSGGNVSGVVLKTKDGGKSWIAKTNAELQFIDEMQFINDSTGYFTNGGPLYRTENAFDTWPAKPLLDSAWVGAYHALNKDVVAALVSAGGVIIGDPTWILKISLDGGDTWQESHTVKWNINNIHFSSPRTGFLTGSGQFGGSIFRTVDSGEHWETRILSFPFMDVHFIDKNKGFAAGGLFAFHFAGGNILVTHDAGKSWEVALSTGVVRACLFVSDLVGFALTSGIWRGPANVLKTTDGGNTWIPTELDITLPDSTFFDPSAPEMFFVDEETGWMSGYLSKRDSAGPAIWGTEDGGRRWDLHWWKKDHNSVHNPDFSSIHFLNDKTGWAVGAGGFIAKSANGRTWQEQKKITDLPLLVVHFIDENNGFISGGYLNSDESRMVLFRTTDGGARWQEIPNLPYLIHDIYFHGAQRGWAIGTDKNRKGVILETRNGGSLWTVQVDNLIGPLNALSYRDHFLWAVGEYGLVLRTPVDSTTGVDDRPDETGTATFKLSQNYPNPFNPATTIEFVLPQPAFVTLKIFNLLGEEVATLAAEKLAAGKHKRVWEAKGLASGIYTYRLEAGDPSTNSGHMFVQARKLILLR